MKRQLYGGLLEAPLPLTRIRLGSGEWAKIVVDLSDGTTALLKSYPEDDFLLLAESLLTDGIGNSHFDLLKIA